MRNELDLDNRLMMGVGFRQLPQIGRNSSVGFVLSVATVRVRAVRSARVAPLLPPPCRP